MSWRIIIAALTALVLSLPGCIGEKDSIDCVRTIEISFYSQTPCQSEPQYPGRIDDLLVCLFNSNGILTQYFTRDAVHLTPDFRETMTVSRTGTYTVSAWSGIDDPMFYVAGLIPGVTEKDDLFLRLGRNQGRTTPSANAYVYYGESSAVMVPATDTDPVETSVNMREVTNRITVIVEGILSDMDDFEVCLESDNGTMAVDSRLLEDEVVTYDPVEREEKQRIIAEFTILKLDPSHTNELFIRDMMDDEYLYRGDLLEALIRKNPQINLACDHDFTIVFTADEVGEDGTYMITYIRVNDWLVHSYDWDGD